MSINRNKYNLGYKDIEYIDDSDEEEFENSAQIVRLGFYIQSILGLLSLRTMAN